MAFNAATFKNLFQDGSDFLLFEEMAQADYLSIRKAGESTASDKGWKTWQLYAAICKMVSIAEKEGEREFRESPECAAILEAVGREQNALAGAWEDALKSGRMLEENVDVLPTGNKVWVKREAYA